MRQLNPTKIFLSAYETTNSQDSNEHATTDLHCALDAAGLTFRYVDDVFNGIPETTFCVFATPGQILETIEACIALGRVFGQDSVLVVHGDNAAELCECSTDCSAIIGTFQQVAAPASGEDCTIADGKFYVVR